MSFLIGSGVAPSYANSTTVTTPAEEEEVLANGNDFETDFTLSDVPAGTDYEISINGLTFLPPATGTAPDVIAPMGGLIVEGNTSTIQATWAACGVFDKESKTVRTFKRSAVRSPIIAAGNTLMKCGNEDYGYRHIKKGHQNDWANLAAITGSNWRDFSDWAINQCLTYPGSVVNNGKSNVYEFKAPIQIRDRRTNRVVSTKYCKVPISRSSKQIITAFPTSK